MKSRRAESDGAVENSQATKCSAQFVQQAFRLATRGKITQPDFRLV